MAQLFTPPFTTVLDANGDPVSGGKALFSTTGTTTPAPVYTTSALSVAHASPVVADSAGRLPAIYLNPEITYRCRIYDAADVLIRDTDPITKTAFDDLIYTAPGTNTVPMTGSAAIARGPVKLDDYLTAAQRTDVATQAGALDVSAALAQAVSDADGWPVELPEGRIRLNTQISRITTLSQAFAKGLKIHGGGSENTLIDTRVANDHAIEVDTNAVGVGYMQRNIELCGFTLTGEYGAPVNAGGIYMRHAFNALVDDVFMRNLTGNGVTIDATEGDTDGSNVVLIQRSRFYAIAKWGLSAAGGTGINEISFLELSDGTQFTACGTDEWKAITGISNAATAIVTAPAHGFANGTLIYIMGVLGMTEINNKSYTVANASTNSFELSGINSTAYGTYTSGGGVGPRSPSSGSIKFKGQMARFRDGYITESFNAGIYVPDTTGTAFRLDIDKFTAENCRRIPILVQGIDGFRLEGCDLRNNDGFKSHCMVFLDSSVRAIRGVHFEANSVRATSGNNPHMAFDGIATNMQDVNIESTNYQASGYDFTGQTRYGSGLEGASALRIIDNGKTLMEPQAYLRTVVTTAGPTYTPNFRAARIHLVQLDTGASGTLTLAAPSTGNVPSTALDGAEIVIMIVNSSGGSINLTLNAAYESSGAPASIANGGTAAARWIYDRFQGWRLSMTWRV